MLEHQRVINKSGLIASVHFFRPPWETLFSGPCNLKMRFSASPVHTPLTAICAFFPILRIWMPVGQFVSLASPLICTMPVNFGYSMKSCVSERPTFGLQSGPQNGTQIILFGSGFFFYRPTNGPTAHRMLGCWWALGNFFYFRGYR